MKTLLVICGIYNIAFALFHVGFWKIFKWKFELKKLNFANRAIIQILNIQIIYYFILTAIICFVFPLEFVNTIFGKLFFIGTSIFWSIRTIQQFIFLNINDNRVHLLTAIFLIGAVLFFLPIFFT